MWESIDSLQDYVGKTIRTRTSLLEWIEEMSKRSLQKNIRIVEHGARWGDRTSSVAPSRNLWGDGLAFLEELERMRTTETRTGLTKYEFNTVLRLLHPLCETIKRGSKPLPLDIRLVILLQWLSFGQTYEQLGLSIGLSGKTIQSAIASIWNLVDEAISMFIPKSPFKYTPTHRFSSFPEAIGAVDATLLPVAKPLDKIKNKLYYSGKHCRHGVKLQVCCAPDGMCIHFGGICPGSQHDFRLFKESGLVEALNHTCDEKQWWECYTPSPTSS